MDSRALLDFLRSRSLAVEATVTPQGAPQAAVVGYVVSDQFELFFDTLDDTRKLKNLRANPKLALVVGWRDPEVRHVGEEPDDEARTAQCEGMADEPKGEDLARLKAIYFARFPGGPAREKWPGITYVRVKLNWVRYSDFRTSPPTIVEFGPKELQS